MFYEADDSIVADVAPSLMKIDVERMETRIMNSLAGRGLTGTICRGDTANDAAFQHRCDTVRYHMEGTTKRFRANANYLVLAQPISGAAAK